MRGPERVLLLGGSGQIGWELRRTLAPFGEVSAPDSGRADLSEPDGLRAAVRGVDPTLIVNAAAYTAVDLAEEQPGLAASVNGTGPGVLAEEAERRGAAIVHFSTDYVFDGTKGEPYSEEDEPNPINVYGETKLAGERAIRGSGAAHLILRTSWVYGMRGRNFMRSMLRLMREREKIRVVDDQIGAPTWCRAIAEATARILAQSGDDLVGFLGENGGLYHLSAGGETSWHGFARAIAELDPDKAEHICKLIEPIPTSEYPTLARRPAYSVLDNGKLGRDLGQKLPDWRTQLAAVFGA